MGERRKRRTWSVAEKCQIVSQTRVPGVSVSQVARRYDVNANLVFKWLRDSRFNSSSEVVEFLPVEVSAVPALIAPPAPSPTTPLPRGAPSCSPPARKLEILLSNGHRLEISGEFDGVAVAQLLRGLSQ